MAFQEGPFHVSDYSLFLPPVNKAAESSVNTDKSSVGIVILLFPRHFFHDMMGSVKSI